MKLIEALGQRSMLIDAIESEYGLINPDVEETLQKVERDILANTDRLAAYYGYVKRDLESRPKEIRAYAKKEQDRLEHKKETLDKFLMMVVKNHGPLKTEWSKMQIVSKKLTRIVIDDHDLVAATYPSAVFIELSEDKTTRTIKISKADLAHQEPVGFHIEEYVSEYIQVKHLD